MNTIPDKRNFVVPRIPHGHQNISDNPKPTYIHETKATNVESKRVLEKKQASPQSNQQAQKTKLSNQYTNRPEKKTEPMNQEIKQPIQKSNSPTQKITQTQPAISAQKTKLTPEGKPMAQKTEQKTSSIEKTKPPENVTSVQNNKGVDEDTQKTKAKASSPVSENTKSDQETNVPQKTTGGQEDKPMETPKDDKDTEHIQSPVESKQKNEQEKTSEDKRELDPLTARVLEEELQDIMIQMWQELPDDPLEEHRIAVDKLRNEVGDDFRRVLGLNITKRLLNVYNNLFVKVHFSCRPQMGCLTTFLSDYRINKFKRIDKNSNTFAAQIDTIEDFDRICSENEIQCGEAKVTVAPCYKFTECPNNLKTIYDDAYYYEYSSPDPIDNKNKDYLQKTEDEEFTQTKNTEAKSCNKTEIISETIDSNDVKKDKTTLNEKKTTDSTNIIENNNVSDKQVKTIANDEAISKNGIYGREDSNNISKDNNESSVTKDNEIDKNITRLDDVNKNIIKDDVVIKSVTKDIDSTKIVTKDIEVGKTAAKDIETGKNIEDIEVNINVIKDVEGSKSVTKDVGISKYITKDITIGDTDDKFDSEDGYEDYLDTEIPENQLESDEELNDEDILALMSTGVVLDECSGSEEET